MFHIAEYLHPADPFVQSLPLDTLQECYLFKHRLAQLLQPKSILELGVRYGYSAAAFLSACPMASYLGLDAETAVAALQRLDTEEREVIVARHWGGLSFEQIAEVVGCSTSTAFRRYTAGVDELRKQLGVTCPNHSSNA